MISIRITFLFVLSYSHIKLIVGVPLKLHQGEGKIDWLHVNNENWNISILSHDAQVGTEKGKVLEGKAVQSRVGFKISRLEGKLLSQLLLGGPIRNDSRQDDQGLHPLLKMVVYLAAVGAIVLVFTCCFEVWWFIHGVGNSVFEADKEEETNVEIEMQHLARKGSSRSLGRGRYTSSSVGFSDEESIQSRNESDTRESNKKGPAMV